MSDWIRFVQRVIGKVTGHRELFALTPEYYGREGVVPSRLRQRQSSLGKFLGVRMFSRAYPGVVGRVHVHDSMLQSDAPEEIEHYIGVGQSALQNIEESLTSAGRSFADIESCLDMACGAGRVLRLLQTKIAPSRITACDIEEEAVRFVAAEFGVRPIVSQKDFCQVDLLQKYDLIWVGSLFTHLEPSVGLNLLEMLTARLNPRGVLIFSTQGEDCLDKLSFYGWMFVPLDPLFREKVAGEGLAYAPYYPYVDPNYGITIYRRDYLENLMREKLGESVRQVRFAACGWDNHQDIWAFQKSE